MLAYPALRPARFSGLHGALVVLVLLAALVPPALRAPAAPAMQRPAGLPLLIVPTDNQAAPFSALGVGRGATFRPDSVRVELAGGPLAVQFLGTAPNVALVPTEQRAGTISRYIGLPHTWRARLPTYAALTYHNLFPGIDLRYDGGAGALKGTYTVAPYTSPAAIRWRYAGAASLAIDSASGDLLIGLADGTTLRETAPVAWQAIAGRHVPVAASFHLAEGVASFTLGAYDPAWPLVIDPTLQLGTFLGGGSTDYGRGIAVDSAGFIYVVGDFFSSDFLGSSTPPSGSTDVLVLKLTPAGDDLVYGMYAGGSGTDTGLAITTNSAGEAFVLIDPDGTFPLKNPVIDTAPEVGDGIVMKFDASGELRYSTYLGLGVATSYTGKAIAAGADGKLYITGQTYIASRRLGQVAVVEVDPASGTVRQRFSPGDDYVTTDGVALAIGPDRRVYVTGTAGSPWGQFPTTPSAFQKQCGAKLILGENSDCGENAFLLVFSPNLAVEYASYLGGSASDKGRGLAVDSQGNAVIVGDATSIDFPVKNALQASCPFEPQLRRCAYVGFATKLSPGAGLLYSTYITSRDEPETQTFISDVVVDGAGNAYVAGFSNSARLPVKDALQPLGRGELCGALSRYCFDAYVLGLAPNGSLKFGSYLGGKFDEINQDIAVDRAGAIYLIGYSESRNFPVTAGSIQPVKSAEKDFYVAKIALGGGSVPGPELRHRSYLPLLQR